MPDGPANTTLWTPANKVTFTRIILIPVFVMVLISPWPQFFPDWMDMPTVKPWLAAAVFIALSLTDTLDGYLARSRGEVTDFGKFMDPLADKLLVTAALLGLTELSVLPSWVSLIIISREFIVSGVRMVAASKGEVIAASWYGKVKTASQMVAIVLFIVKDSHVITDFSALKSDWLYLLSWTVMLFAVVMTIVSMFDYLYKARYVLGFRNKADAKPSGAVVLPDMASINAQAEVVLSLAREKGFMLATAESCTGGLIAAVLTNVAGSSDVFLGSVVSYANSVKEDLLQVSGETLALHGAVSEETACQMAEGARACTGADLTLSVTGVAGPSGGSPEKPVGTVWIGLASRDGVSAQLFNFEGSRDAVRIQTTCAALELFRTAIQNA